MKEKINVSRIFYCYHPDNDELKITIKDKGVGIKTEKTISIERELYDGRRRLSLENDWNQPLNERQCYIWNMFSWWCETENVDQVMEDVLINAELRAARYQEKTRLELLGADNALKAIRQAQ